MGLLHTQQLSPFLPVPLQMQGPSPLAVLPRGFYFNHCLSCHLAFYGGGTPGILHAVQDPEMALKEKSHSRENEFVPGVKLEKASTQGTLHTRWVQSLFLCEAPGVLTLKPTPTTSSRTPPRPGLCPLTTLLPCLLLQGTGCSFSGLMHKHPFPAQWVSHQRAPHSCLTCYLIHRGALKWPGSFLQAQHQKSLQAATSQLFQPTSTPASSALPKAFEEAGETIWGTDVPLIHHPTSTTPHPAPHPFYTKWKEFLSICLARHIPAAKPSTAVAAKRGSLDRREKLSEMLAASAGREGSPPARASRPSCYVGPQH